MADRSKSIAEQLGLGRPRRRPARVAQTIQQELAMLFVSGAKDPRLRPVTLTSVEVSPDLQRAVIFYVVPESEAAPAAAGLASAKGFLRSHLARVMNLRYMPELVFQRDLGQEKRSRIEELLREIEEQDDESSR